MATASVDGTARIWDPVTGAELVRLRHDGPVLEEAACRAYVEGVTTEAVADLVAALGMSPLPSSRLAAVAAALDATVDEDRHRPLWPGPFPTAMVEVLGVTMTEDDEKTGWRNLLRQFVARGLRGIAVVRSDACTTGLLRAVRAELPEATCEGPMTDAASSGQAETFARAPTRTPTARPRPSSSGITGAGPSRCPRANNPSTTPHPAIGDGGRAAEASQSSPVPSRW